MAKEKNKTELPKVMEGELRARLIKLREDAGFDVSQMASALCLSEEVIINLENEAFDLLAEPPYVRGYLRNYAKLGDGDDDASELISRYESLRGADATELDFQIKSSSTIETSPQKRLSPVLAQVIMLGVLIGGIALLSTIPGVKSWVSGTWDSLSSKLEPSNADNNPSLLGQLPVPAPLPGDEITTPQQSEKTGENKNTPSTSEDQNEAGQNTSPDSKSTTNNADSIVNTTSSETSSESSSEADNTNSDVTNTNDNANSNTADSQQSTTENNTDEVIPTDQNGMINIKLVFNKEVWLRIKDKENKTVFEGLNKAGTEKIINLKKPLTFRVGNAQGLSMLIDDKAVDISTYINGSIANFTLE